MPSEGEKWHTINLHQANPPNDQGTARNRSERSSLRTSVKIYRDVLAGGDQALAAGEYPEIQKKIDKAVTKGILHTRTAHENHASFSLK